MTSNEPDRRSAALCLTEDLIPAMNLKGGLPPFSMNMLDRRANTHNKLDRTANLDISLASYKSRLSHFDCHIVKHAYLRIDAAQCNTNYTTDLVNSL